MGYTLNGKNLSPLNDLLPRSLFCPLELIPVGTESQNENDRAAVPESVPIQLKDKYSCILCVIILLCNNPVTLLIRAPDKRGY